MEIEKAKELVIKAGKELVNRGLIARTWGNVSCRIDTNTFVITPSGREYLTLTPDEIVLVTIESLEHQGDVKPSSEKGAHAEVYKAKPAVMFVIHTHQENASIISGSGLSEIHVDPKYSTLNGSVLVTGYGLPSTKKLAKNIAKTTKKSVGNAMILKNHGALCFGSSYEETFQAAVELENACSDFIESVAQETFQLKDHVSENSLYQEIITKDLGIENEKINIATIDQIGTDRILLELKKYFSFVGVEAQSACLAAAKLKKPIQPMVDDFAQIIGLKMNCVSLNLEKIISGLKASNAILVENIGAICVGETELDVQARKMIAAKTCKVQLCAELFGIPKPINKLESRLMNVIYKQKYSKQI